MKELGFEVMHVGLNCKDTAEAQQTADLLLSLFGFSETDTPISVFSSSKIEIMKKKGAGTLGHIAIGTTDVPAAKKYLEGKGIEFDNGTAAYNEENGELKLIYLKNEIAGFAFHLLKK
ncbi:hypothetical protein CAFE_19270 [Caprobacter fermentans]|uniref:VOC domain-containing protein n=1 Tax=Caproicibacter fermentans TaxID=2576756 RepID=A0A6N8HZU4_9FIRM|nr:VOC family protein [Caproicibacter fermentans]MVB11219.1 hypothetical protein [Caproicibacter fermentans]